MGQTRLHTDDAKGQATQGNSTWRTRMAGLLTGSCSLVCERLCHFSLLKRYDVSFLYFDWSELHFMGI